MKLYSLPLVLVLLSGCATAPLIVRSSPNFLTVGSERADLRGSSFYMAIGNIDLYRHRAFGGVTPIGRVAESPVALQIDTSGRVTRIVTLQQVADQRATTSTTLNSVTTIVQNDVRYVLGPLVGGISVIDIHPYPSWLDTLSALRKAMKEIGVSGNYRISTRANVSTTVFSPPIFGWFPHWWHGDPRRRHR